MHVLPFRLQCTELLLSYEAGHSFETVVTLCLEIKIALITSRQNFFQVFVLKERGCFSNTRWNRVCANVGANIFPRL